jgi:hypothetical protein
MSMAPTVTFASHGPSGSAHQVVPSESYYPAATTGGYSAVGTPRSNKKKWWIIGGVVLGLAAVVAIVVGVVVSQLNKGSSDNTNNGNEVANSGANSTIRLGTNPSVFDKDDRLKQSFWGFAYTPNVSNSLDGADGSLRRYRGVEPVRPTSLEIYRCVILSELAQSSDRRSSCRSSPLVYVSTVPIAISPPWCYKPSRTPK